MGHPEWREWMFPSVQTGTSSQPAISLSERTCDLKGKLTMTSLIAYSSLPRFSQTHFPLLLHYPQSVQKHFPKGLPSPIYTSLALAPRYSSKEWTRQLVFSASSLDSPSVHWGMLQCPHCALAGSAGEKTQTNLSLPIPGKQQLERGSVQGLHISQPNLRQLRKLTSFC